MREKVAVITGATDGIGYEVARGILEAGQCAVLHGRDKQKLERVAGELEAATGDGLIETVVGDLSSLESVQKLSDEIKKRYNRIDILINNAGIFQNTFERSRDGFELTYAVNHLSHFLLTINLLDRIKMAEDARVVHVSSMVHVRAGGQLDRLNEEAYFEPYNAYAESKLCNGLFALELAERFKGSHIKSNFLHPGVIDTKLLKQAFANAGGAPAKNGAETILYLALSEEMKDVTGQYYSDLVVAEPNPLVHDSRLRKSLWELSEEQCGIKVK